MQLPPPSQKRLQQREELVRRLRELLGDPDQIIHRPEDLVVYECDALSAYRQQPMAVILASSAEEVSRVVRLCGEIDIPIVPWGAGTGLSGGALPLSDGVVISLARMNRILDIDLENRAVTVEAGVTNLAITRAVEDRGFYYAPDPSSQLACTIGGNVAENSGGVHCLKYGTTTNNILGVQVVLADGEVVDLGGKSMDQGGYDLLALMTGSEGLLGIITEATVRILRKPESARAFMAVFDSVESTGRAVSDIIASGMVPSGMEIMDRLSIEAVEDFLGCGYPRGVEALLLVELDGVAAEVEARIGTLETLLRQAGATELRRADTEEERARLWSGRKAAFPAMGRVAPDYYCMDGTIPRGRLPEVLHLIQAMSKDFGLQVANVFHAGDGNLHPLILYDSNAPGELERAESFGAEILQLCVRVGGVLSGEHGIGVEKRDLMPCMFTDADLDTQERVKAAFDPRQLLNPGKVFPLLRRCIPGGSMHVHAGELPFPGLERF
ncbi:MAG: FAD-linked oxidase C-terminal domain-containing protein [Candidatus Latescibacterota bacterium]|nr:FAD-linked oxidase C-terminal domain-containing protein [Candidatus Latescibacterota bacterium]